MKPYNLILLIALIPLLMCKWSLSNAERFREAPKPSINDSILYLKGSVPLYTIEVKVLGSLTNPAVRSLAWCESNMNPSAVNMEDVHRNKDGEISIGSFGLLMFGIPTWEHECVERFGIEDDIDNPNLQIQCAELLLEAGEHWRWENCWRIIHE